jgi:hypothetical protein
MGAIADGFAAYAQPLIEGTDGSMPQLNRAMTIAQLCWNLALVPEGKREEMLNDMKPTLKMADEDFAEFRRDVVLPMIQRHHEMFPGLHGRSKRTSNKVSVMPAPTESSTTKEYAAARRNAPCPCGSGRKYKHCCGARR